MKNRPLLITLVGLIGTVLTFFIFKFFFKRTVTFWVGTFLILMVNITITFLTVEFFENHYIDKFVGLVLIMSSGIGLAFGFDSLIGKFLRILSEQINRFAEGKLDIEDIDKRF